MELLHLDLFWNLKFLSLGILECWLVLELCSDMCYFPNSNIESDSNSNSNDNGNRNSNSNSSCMFSLRASWIRSNLYKKYYKQHLKFVFCYLRQVSSGSEKSLSETYMYIYIYICLRGSLRGFSGLSGLARVQKLTQAPMHPHYAARV